MQSKGERSAYLEYRAYLDSLRHPFDPRKLGEALHTAAHAYNMGGMVVSAPLTPSRIEYLLLTLIEDRCSQPRDGVIVSIGTETSPDQRKTHYDMRAGGVIMNRQGKIIGLQNIKRYILPKALYIVDGNPIYKGDLEGTESPAHSIHLLVPPSAIDPRVHDAMCSDIFAGQPGIKFSCLGVDYEPEDGQDRVGPGSVLRPTRLLTYPNDGFGDIATYVNEDPREIQDLVESGVFPGRVDGIATVKSWLYAPLEPGVPITPQTFLVPAHA